MARNIGPEMLARLDARRDTMTDTEYAARRIEIEELIRKGKAVEFSRADNFAKIGIVMVAMVAGIIVMAGLASGGSMGAAWIAGLVIIGGGIWVARSYGRR